MTLIEAFAGGKIVEPNTIIEVKGRLILRYSTMAVTENSLII
jgi:hypothetical protein